MGRRWGLRHVKSVQSHFRKVGKPIFPKNGEVKFAFYSDEPGYDNILQRVRAAMATYGYEKSVQEMLMDKVCVRNVLYEMARNVTVPNLKEYFRLISFWLIFWHLRNQIH